MHWACKRGHQTIVERLLQNGADRSIQTAKGETSLELTENHQIRNLLGGKTENMVLCQSLSVYHTCDVLN